MLAELDIAIFLQSDGDLAATAQRVFKALGSEPQSGHSEEWGDHYAAAGLGFRAVLFRNEGEMLAPEFERYQYSLEIMSLFSDSELDPVDLEMPLSDYYARLLAFTLNVETATAVPVEIDEEREVFEVRAFKRNPNYRLDQGPTVPKVFVVETRELVEAFDDTLDEEPASEEYEDE